MESKGAENHEINILYYGATSGANGLQFNGGDVTLDASGPASGNGDAGKITLGIDKTVRSALGKVIMRANGHGNGKGGQISFNPGAVDIKIGGSNEEYSFSAKGGDTDGDGGKIDIQGYSSSISVKDATSTATVLDVSVPGSTGNGGEINIVAYGTSGLSFDATAPSYLKADGGTSDGDGGKITILTTNVPLTIGGTNGSVALSAMAKGGDGAGGTLDITSWSGITADTLKVEVSAEGEGNGGTVKLNAGYSTFTLNGGELHTDGGTDGGDGGLIHIEGGGISLPTEENTLLTANGRAGGDGGTVEVVTQWASVNFGSENGSIQIQAEGSATIGLARKLLLAGHGIGGSIKVIQQKSYTLSSSAELSVTAFDDGDGGLILLECTEFVTINGKMYADGTGEGKGGTISIESPVINFGLNSELNANAGTSGNGEGGYIFLLNEGGTQIDLTFISTRVISAKGNGSGKGGHVTIDLVSPFWVNKVIEVDGANVIGGTIKLNGISAFRHSIPALSGFGKVFWTDNENATVDQTNLGEVLTRIPSGLQASLLTAEYNVYMFDNPTAYDTFFTDFATSVPGAVGVTRHEQRSISIFARNANNELNPAPLSTAVHEFGHAIDNCRVISSKISSGFRTALTALFVSLTSQDSDPFTTPNPCATEFNTSNFCTQEPDDTNWQRWVHFMCADQTSNDEIFAYNFEAKACNALGIGGSAWRLDQYTRNGSLKTYFDGLWV